MTVDWVESTATTADHPGPQSLQNRTLKPNCYRETGARCEMSRYRSYPAPECPCGHSPIAAL